MILDLIHICIAIPFIAFILTFIINGKKENTIANIAFGAILINTLLGIAITANWLISGFDNVSYEGVSIYHSEHYHFFLDFYFDKISAVYFLVGSAIALIIAYFSRFYMHNEAGFKRYFNTVILFYIGYIITILSGNFETLFIGWEILGVSSFLLIAFYRNRYLPVKNAIKVFTIYRIGDVGILLAMWLCHHIWHHNIIFTEFEMMASTAPTLTNNSGASIFIALMIVIAACAKSAQLPFSAWLPRAMEGPTPSSAIFYGSLSVHIGAFLLLRTFSFWEAETIVRIIIGLIGLLTAIIATLIANVQPTIKGKIAYSSAAQIGIIFIEIALGLEVLALIHFAGNAFLRTYQLLVSPSMVTYWIREQFYNYEYIAPRTQNKIYTKISAQLYLLSLKEWYLDRVIFHFVFQPLKFLSKMLSLLLPKNIFIFSLVLYIVLSYYAYIEPLDNASIRYAFATGIAFLALLLVTKAYNEKNNAIQAFLLIIMAHFFIDLAVTFNDLQHLKESSFYLSGVVFSGIIGFLILKSLAKRASLTQISLAEFQGISMYHKWAAFIFFLSCLGLAGFPITTTFLGEDLILTHVHENQVLLALFISLTFIVTGIALIRLYSRVFLGKINKNYQSKVEITL